MQQAATSPEHLAFMRNLDLQSLMTVPLIAANQCFGVLTFCYTSRSGRHHGPIDLALAQELARRASLAVEHARLHAETRAARAQAEQAEQRARFLCRGQRAADYIARSGHHASSASRSWRSRASQTCASSSWPIRTWASGARQSPTWTLLGSTVAYAPETRADRPTWAASGVPESSAAGSRSSTLWSAMQSSRPCRSIATKCPPARARPSVAYPRAHDRTPAGARRDLVRHERFPAQPQPGRSCPGGRAGAARGTRNR